MAVLFWVFSGKTAIFPLAYSLALLVAWGYTLVDAAFRLVSPRYRRHPEFFLDAMKEVTLPRGAEVIYAGLERFRERALCLPPKTSGAKAFLLAPLLVFPWLLLIVVGQFDALVLGVEGLLTGLVLALFGYSVDLAAALLRYRWV